MSCGEAGKKKSIYTGNQVGWLNYTGDYNFVAGGPPGSGLSAGTTVIKFIPKGTNKRPWLRADAVFDDKLLDACYPTIGLKWFVEINLKPGLVFRVSNQAFYVQDEDGLNRFIDARCINPPMISVTVGEWLNPNYEVSDASFSLNNRDGLYNQYLPLGENYVQWSGASINVYIGFGEKRSNYFLLFEGQITTKQGLTATRDTVDIKAYDKLDNDEIPMPPRVYSSDNFPDILDESAGKPIPIIYGDWTDDVPDAGSINATCINANSLSAQVFLFKVSDIQLESITEIYLHRGERKEGVPGGPVSIDLSMINIDLANGQFAIPMAVDVLDEEVTYGDGETAGPGSGLDFLTAKEVSTDFVLKRVQVGDRIVKTSTNEEAFIVSIATTQLTLSGGVTFSDGDEYQILTKKYAFISGDKVTVKCKGKPLNLVSVNRLTDLLTTIKKPQGISISTDQTYWIADDNTQKIYHINFDDGIIKSFDYADVDASITAVTSISIGSDDKLWVTALNQSNLYRFDHAAGATGLIINTSDIIGIGVPLADIKGIAIESTNRFWIVDNATGAFYEVDAFSAVQPFTTRAFNRTAFASTATDIQDIAVDEEDDQIIVVDRNNNNLYRVDATTGALQSTLALTALADNVGFVTGVSQAQDGSLFFVDQGTLSVYNYNEQSDASTNVAFIARDLFQKYGNHNYNDFDLMWNQTARQLSNLKARVCFDKATNLVTFVNKLLNEFNIVFHIRFNKFSLFWINFPNFRANGKFTGEKDIKEDTFRPNKEMNQYFNSVTTTYNLRPFTGVSKTSDTYVSPAAVSFAGKEVNKKLDFPHLYRREDVDVIMPLLVKLAAPDPEFVDITYGFRIIRSQMQDFLVLHFDGDVNCVTGLKESGRRFDHIPCMIRKLQYDLGVMSVTMKLWSLGTTQFGTYKPKGPIIGGEFDTIVLSNLTRLGRVSPIGTIVGAGATIKDIEVEDVDMVNADNRQNGAFGKSWNSSFIVDLMDGATKEVIQTLTVFGTSGSEINFLEDVSVTLQPTVKNAAGFIVGGHYLQYSSYDNTTNAQKQVYASYSKPTSNYPTSNTQELEEQRSGAHSFDDGGLPYGLYPIDFVSH